MPLSPKQAAEANDKANEQKFQEVCAQIDAALVKSYYTGVGSVTIGCPWSTDIIKRIQSAYGAVGWSVKWEGDQRDGDFFHFSHQPESAPSEPMVIEDEYMRVELVPADQNGYDAMYGDVRWIGSSLRVTIKQGMIADTQMINVGSRGYVGLVSEEPTVLFSMVEPNR